MVVFRNILISAVVLILFGWGMISFYGASMDIAEYSKDTTRDYIFEINVTPILAIICVVGILAYISYSKKKKSNKSWAKALLLPDEFQESDEREKQITAKACRAAYISMWYAFPIITVLLLFYPFISDTVPYYPIIVLLLLPLTQCITYLISWKKYY